MTRADKELLIAWIEARERLPKDDGRHHQRGSHEWYAEQDLLIAEANAREAFLGSPDTLMYVGIGHLDTRAAIESRREYELRSALTGLETTRRHIPPELLTDIWVGSTPENGEGET